MATVWAYRVGAFRADAASGWSHTINFTSLGNLRDQLDALGLHRRVARLAVVAHGDLPGRIAMDGVSAEPASAFGTLASFLQPDAMLIFVACIVAALDTGSQFLVDVSGALPGRVIVGFNRWGYVETSFGAFSAPGNVQVSTGGGVPTPGATRLHPWCAWAKWAHQGVIVRLAEDEQAARDGRRCANPSCPGHAAAGERCRAWLTDPVLRAYAP